MGKTNPQQLLADYILSNQESYYRLAYSYVKNPDDSLDIVHESSHRGHLQDAGE